MTPQNPSQESRHRHARIAAYKEAAPLGMRGRVTFGIVLVGAARFELATFWSRTNRPAVTTRNRASLPVASCHGVLGRDKSKSSQEASQ